MFKIDRLFSFSWPNVDLQAFFTLFNAENDRSPLLFVTARQKYILIVTLIFKKVASILFSRITFKYDTENGISEGNSSFWIKKNI